MNPRGDRDMTEMLKSFLERLVPDLVVATAAMGVFVLLGVMVLVSILFERWQAAGKRRAKPALLENLPLNPPAKELSRGKPRSAAFPRPAAVLRHPPPQQI